MPLFPSLAPALAFLQSSAAVTTQAWIPGPGPQGHAHGTWGAVTNLPKPYTVDVPTGTRAQVQTTGGEVLTADLAVYCRSSAAPDDAADGGRQPRLYWHGKRYRVVGKRDIDGHPSGAGTVALMCVADNGGEP